MNLIVRPLHERYVGKMKIRSNVHGKFEQRHTRNAVELAIQFKDAGEEVFSEGDSLDKEDGFEEKSEPAEDRHLPEIFVDFGIMDLEDRETHIDADGVAMGIGLRAPPPSRPGYGWDYLLRVGYMGLDFDHSTYNGLKPTWSYKGPTSDFKVGGYYAINVGEAVLLSPMAGLYYKSIDDEWNWVDSLYDDDDDPDHSESDPDKSDKDNFHLYSLGFYTGVKVNHASLDYFDVSLYFFKGLYSVDGIFLSAAIRF